MTLEAMKMQSNIYAPIGGRIAKILVSGESKRGSEGSSADDYSVAPARNLQRLLFGEAGFVRRELSRIDCHSHRCIHAHFLKCANFAHAANSAGGRNRAATWRAAICGTRKDRCPASFLRYQRTWKEIPRSKARAAGSRPAAEVSSFSRQPRTTIRPPYGIESDDQILSSRLSRRVFRETRLRTFPFSKAALPIITFSAPQERILSGARDRANAAADAHFHVGALAQSFDPLRIRAFAQRRIEINHMQNGIARGTVRAGRARRPRKVSAGGPEPVERPCRLADQCRE